MDTTPELTRSEVIDRVRAARADEQAAAIAQVELIAEWARLNPCQAEETPAHWGEPHLFAESVTPLAGQGAPLVREFAPAELAAALGISLDAARQQVADSLELTYRLPGLWAETRAGRVPLCGPRRSRGRPTTWDPTRSPSPTGCCPPPRTRSARSTPPA